MKKGWMIGCAMLAFPLMGAELAINAAPTGTLEDDQELTLAAPAEVTEKATVVISATIRFSRPAETPIHLSTVSTSDDKLVIVSDTDGQLLIADGAEDAWLETGITVDETDDVQVEAIGTRTADDRLTFDITLTVDGTATTFEGILSPSEATTIEKFIFEGEGEAEAVSIALAPTAIVPATGDAQEAALVTKYAEWTRSAGKDFPTGATDAERSNAFAMNVGGVPKLEIIAIDVAKHTISVKGTYQGETATDVADLARINGKLYIAYASTLTGEVTVDEVEISVVKDGIAVISFPEAARFIKASVALSEPEKKL